MIVTSDPEYHLLPKGEGGEDRSLADRWDARLVRTAHTLCRCALTCLVLLATAGVTLDYCTGTRINRWQLSSTLVVCAIEVALDTKDTIRTYVNGGAQEAFKYLLYGVVTWPIGVLSVTMLWQLHDPADVQVAVVATQRVMAVVAIFHFNVGWVLWLLAH